MTHGARHVVERAVNESYYQQVGEAFDEAAQGYDALYQINVVMAWMRQESLALLQAVFPSGSRLLELGCGTGEEALALHRLGYRVVAIDISAQMIATARAAGAEGIDWRVLPAGQLAQLAAEFGAGAFDGAYSSFGALNCEPHLPPIAAALAHLLPSGAPLLCSVMNRCCLWELGWFALHLQPRAALRRLRNGWVAASLVSQGGAGTVPVRYYSPRQFTRAFSPYFVVEQVVGLPVLWPPPYLDHLVRRHSALFAQVGKLERRVRTWFPFYPLGDHFAVHLRRV